MVEAPQALPAADAPHLDLAIKAACSSRRQQQQYQSAGMLVHTPQIQG
jgi:hypothetical protein